ncbi:hypothetical protein INR49_020550 [Caranx melampygus]|nr:hypothetical protein INR49_020550 [Caranx melampygus]
MLGRNMSRSTSQHTTAFMLGCLCSSVSSRYDAFAAVLYSGSPSLLTTWMSSALSCSGRLHSSSWAVLRAFALVAGTVSCATESRAATNSATWCFSWCSKYQRTRRRSRASRLPLAFSSSWSKGCWAKGRSFLSSGSRSDSSSSRSVSRAIRPIRRLPFFFTMDTRFSTCSSPCTGASWIRTVMAAILSASTPEDTTVFIQRLLALVELHLGLQQLLGQRLVPGHQLRVLWAGRALGCVLQVEPLPSRLDEQHLPRLELEHAGVVSGLFPSRHLSVFVLLHLFVLRLLRLGHLLLSAGSRCSIALRLVSDDLLPAQRPDAQLGDELLQLALLQIIDGVLLPSIHQLVGFIQTGQEDVVGLKVNMREDQTSDTFRFHWTHIQVNQSTSLCRPERTDASPHLSSSEPQNLLQTELVLMFLGGAFASTLRWVSVLLPAAVFGLRFVLRGLKSHFSRFVSLAVLVFRCHAASA